MYVPDRFAAPRLDVLHALVDGNPLGALVRAGADGLDADHLPFQLVPAGPGAPHGLLRAHVARANPLWRADGAGVLVLFRGAHGYASPLSHDLRKLDGRVVPTWNYAVVHVHGRLRAVDDRAWLLAHMEAATRRHEGARGWQIADAPQDHIDRLLRATVGIEIAIERIEGKFKR
ncbi:FMN-binding negative transcriptional regulator [uncultured Massilia sp.]|uniref:FMN-binding negative transcriptional regulator n=1 Tax=uncultured Massilia sp. TaxID=169973 RepID=UPI0025F4E249|nr:FMN-binding negative transcriptional regulator [uncultured Massilia sp.]